MYIIIYSINLIMFLYFPKTPFKSIVNSCNYINNQHILIEYKTHSPLFVFE